MTEAGIWDFWFGSSVLNNSFSTSMALDLGVYASTVAGCGSFPSLDSCETSYTLLSSTIYTGDAFALDFAASATLGRFSINVLAPTAVPELSSLTLLGLGGLAMVGWRRRPMSA